ncbi:MAG: translocation/assembly module TamB domain-containing protein [Bacteroidales bacterium]
MRQSIKKIYKSVLISLLVLFLLPAGAFLLIQNNKVQTYLVQKLTGILSENLNAQVTLSHVNIGFFNRINIDDLLIRDQRADTMIYAPRVTCSITGISRVKKEVVVHRMIFNRPSIYLYTDSSKNINIQFLLDATKSKPDTTREKWDFLVRGINISKALFTYKYDVPGKIQEGSIDFTNIRVTNLNLNIEDLNLPGDSLTLHVRKLNGIEKTGLKINEFNTDLTIDSTFLHWRNIVIKTDRSTLLADYFLMDYATIRDIAVGRFGKKVRLNLAMRPSVLSLEDMAFITPVFRGIPHSLEVSGRITGKINDLKGRNIRMVYNKRSVLSGNFDFLGLPDIKHTFLYANIKEFSTTAEDIESIDIPAMKRKIELPSAARQFGMINYTGRFTGFFDDFVAYGKLESRLGSMFGDLVITHDNARNFTFRGSLSGSDFDLGNLVPTRRNLFGRVDFAAEVDGMKDGKRLNGKVEGKVSSLGFNKYNYHNIDIHGTFTNDTYDGSITVNDPNFEMDFLGRLDFSSERPEYDFTANIPRANLHAMNFSSQDSLMNLSCILTANFLGNNLNTFDGDIKLLNATIERTGKKLYLYNLGLSAVNTSDSGSLVLRSDFADARLDGQYDFKTLAYSFHGLIRKYLPSFTDLPVNPDTTAINRFRFQVKIKDAHELFSFFEPTLSVSNRSMVNGFYNPAGQELVVNGYCDTLIWKDFRFDGLTVNGSSTGEEFEISSGSKLLSFKNQLNFENFTSTARLHNDSIFAVTRTINWDTLLNKGNVVASGVVYRLPGNTTPVLDFLIQPSQVIVKNIAWNIDPCRISVDTSGISIRTFNLFSGDQFLRVDGEARKNEGAKLRVAVQQLNAQNLNIFTRDKGFTFTGKIAGSAALSDFFKAPVFEGEFNIDSLTINGEVLGNTRVGMAWKSEENKIDIDVASWRQKLQTVDASGYYVPGTHEINMDISLNKLRVNILRPYFAKIFSNINGQASGKLHLGGTTLALLMDGELDCQKISFMVDYLRTRYNFSDIIRVEQNRFYCNNIAVNDEAGNKGLLNGWVYGRNFKYWTMDLNLEAVNMLCLNTMAKDNDLYYGKVYATGTGSITGPIENLKMNIKGSTDKNSVLYIPLTSGEEVTENRFITFKGGRTTDHKNSLPANNPLNLAGIQMNFEFTITPDAEAQLIFDPKMGDIIRGRGNGNIKMDINTLGKFRMFGDFVIDEGEYLFTLQNVINKRFKVERGGTVSWNGDPLDANLNIRAVYPVKTSVYDLLILEANEEYKKRIPIECEIYLTDKLMKPTIRYDINLPTAEEELKSKVRDAVNTQEELSKQFLSLLVLNSFMPDPNRTTAGEGTNALGAAGVGVTTSELLSNQLSNWLSQISNDFDIGVNYRPGDEITSQQVEVALSTQLLNDRVSINGNLDVRGNQAETTTQTSASNIVGDFVVDVKLTESGKLRVKAFNRTNDKILYDISPYTQGVGISYQEDFNNFRELLKRYWSKPIKKEEEPVPLPVIERKAP